MSDVAPVAGREKPKVGFYWCASCGGCEEAVVDLAEQILYVAGAVDIVFWPVAMDFKRKDVEAMPDGSILALFVNGAIRSTEQEEMARLLRRKSRLIVAFGACAQLGGIPGLANLFERAEVLKTAYQNTPSTANPEGVHPEVEYKENGRTVTLPGFYHTVRTLDQTIEVDYYIPGCPPTPKIVVDALGILLKGELPPKGSVLAPDFALCEECARKDSRPERLGLKGFKRPHEVWIDESTCLLAQGVVCLGPATRAGCGAMCPLGNMPCTGCFGPTSRVKDPGAKALSAIASLIESNDEEEIIRIVNTIPDPTGTFYRYSLPASLLRRKKFVELAGPDAARNVREGERAKPGNGGKLTVIAAPPSKPKN
jgi:F420-non-reducing hydrogenase small subunit